MNDRAILTFLICVLVLVVMVGTYQLLEHFVFPALDTIQQEVK